MKINSSIYDFSKPWEKDKTPLLLIHGHGATSNMWFPQIPAFSSNFPVITVDLPGCGDSPKIEEQLSIKTIADSIYNEVKGYGFKKINIAGISLGALISVEMVARQSDFYNKVILCGMPFDFPEAIKKILYVYMKEIKDKKIDFRNYVTDRAQGAFGKLVKPEMVKYLADLLSSMDPVVYSNLGTAALDYNLKDGISNVKNDTLLICGELDDIGSIDATKQIARKIEKSTIEILKDTGHAMSLENPKIFNDKVLSFL